MCDLGLPCGKSSCSYAAREKIDIPCQICGDLTPMTATKLCDDCWEMQKRIQRRPEIAELLLAAVKGTK